MDFKKSLAIGMLGAALASFAGAQTQYPRMTINDVGTTQGSLQVIPRDLNNNGVVAGSIKYARSENAFVFDGTLRDIGQLPGRPFAGLNTINRSGVGMGTSGTGNLQRGFIFQNNTVTEFNTLDPFLVPITRGGWVNDAGTLLWDAFDINIPSVASFYRFNYGNRSIPPINAANIVDSRSITMNQRGFALGVESWIDGTTHAWRCDPGTAANPPTNTEFNYRTGDETFIEPKAIVDFGGDATWGVLVANVGTVVVDTSNISHVLSRGVMDDGSVWNAVPLGTDTITEVNDVQNFSNFVVGRSGRHTFINGRFTVSWTGCIFQREILLDGSQILRPTDINSLLPLNSGIRVDNCIAINNSGQIAATYTQNGVVRGVLLNPQSTPQLLQLRDATTLQLSNNVVGGNSHLGDVAIDVPDPDADVILTGSSSSAVARPPSSIVIPRNESQTRFVIQTNAVTVSTPVTITVSRAGFGISATLRVNPATISSITLTSATDAQGTNVITGGLSVPGRVNFDGLVGSTSGALVNMSSSIAAAQVPATVTVPFNTRFVNFTVTTSVVTSPQLATISARHNSVTKTKNLRVTTPFVADLTLSSPNVVGGTSLTATITLSGNALAPGAVVTTTSSNTNVATVPGTVTILTGTKTRTFPIATRAQSLNVAVTITASFNGSSKTRTLIVRAPQLISFTIAPPTTVLGGAVLTGTVIIDGNAPSTGWDVFLTTSDARAATVPTFVRVQPGNSSATFPITTLIADSTRDVIISATRATVTKTQTIRVNAADLQAVQLAGFIDVDGSTTLNANDIVQIRFVLNRPAQAGGARIFLLSSDTTNFVLPNGVIVPAGQTQVTINVLAGAAGTFTTTATRGLITRTLDVVVN